jgi:hypothetical protein
MNKKRILSLLLVGALAATPLYAHAATDFGGTVTSFGSENARVTLSLIPVGSTEAVKTVSVTGKETTYVMEGVSNGEYILKASKFNHATREYVVMVDGGELTQDVALCLQGDVSGDGRINVGDTAKCYSHVRKTNLLTDAYAQACADMNGDGRLNVGDTAKIYGLVRNPDGMNSVPAIPTNPVEDNKNAPFQITGATALDVEVGSGHLVYFSMTQVTGMTLTVDDPMAYVICNGVTYEAKDGQVVIPQLRPATASGPITLAVGNRSGEDLVFPMTVNYEPGHEQNPIEIGGFLEFEAPVSAGGLSYFNLYRLSETNLTIEDPMAYVIYNGTTYEAANGVVTVPDLYSANTNTPILIAIGNRAAADKVFNVTMNYDPGHQMNPIALSNGNLSTYCAAGNNQGVYYSYTAAKDGTLTIRLTQTVDCNITITSDIVEGGTRSISLSDEEGSTSLSFKMTAGETVSVCIVMNPINGFNYPEGTVNTTVRFR